jgi:hypothetical protein
MKPVLIAAVVGVCLLVALGARHSSEPKAPPPEEKLVFLDPAQVQSVRTPGGFLQVGELVKAEEFGWQTSWDCSIIGCEKLPKTSSKIRVKAHYVYKIPLAEEWRLEFQGDHYKLAVPRVRLQTPIAFDTTTIELETKGTILSPSSKLNREHVIRFLGPELAVRGTTLPYMDMQYKAAEKTIVEFAQKWMLEQGKKISLPIQVAFDQPDPS